MTKENYIPNCIHIHAKEGYPSTLWVSKTGKYYPSKKKAIDDLAEESVSKDDNVIKKSFFKKYRAYILCALIAAAVATVVTYYAPVILAKLKK